MAGMSPEMTNFDLIPSPAGDGTLRGYLRGRFFDRLTAPSVEQMALFFRVLLFYLPVASVNF